MEIKKNKFERVSLDVFSTLDDVDGRLIRGRAIVDAAGSRCTFVQNEPRGPRSTEIGRTLHARVVRRPDGRYTATFRCESSERWLTEMLINEAREVGRIVRLDADLMSRNKKSTKGGGNGRA